MERGTLVEHVRINAMLDVSCSLPGGMGVVKLRCGSGGRRKGCRRALGVLMRGKQSHAASIDRYEDTRMTAPFTLACTPPLALEAYGDLMRYLGGPGVPAARARE